MASARDADETSSELSSHLSDEFADEMGRTSHHSDVESEPDSDADVDALLAGSHAGTASAVAPNRAGASSATKTPARPAKRRRVTATRRTTAAAKEKEKEKEQGSSPGQNRFDTPSSVAGIYAAGVGAAHMSPSTEIDDDLSSDSSASPPGSPRSLAVLLGPDEDALRAEHATACSWEGCETGDLGNQDELVKHVQEVHIESAKGSKTTCEWSDCKAKGKTAMSAYALRAHMRSHTKEKPFYCALPECDRSFTRSDALAKHMRTVHENEHPVTNEFYSQLLQAREGKRGREAKDAANGSRDSSSDQDGEGDDYQAATPRANKHTKSLKLVFNKNTGSSANKGSSNANKTPESSSLLNNNTASPDDGDAPIRPRSPLTTWNRDPILGPLPTYIGFGRYELFMPRNELFRLLRRQIAWATEESETIAIEAKESEEQYKAEWLRKEVLLENIMEAEFVQAECKGIVRDEGQSIEGLPSWMQDFMDEDDEGFDAEGMRTAEDGLGEAVNGTKKGRHSHTFALKGISNNAASGNAGAGPGGEKKVTGRSVVQRMEDDVTASAKLPVRGGDKPWGRLPELMKEREIRKVQKEKKAAHDAAAVEKAIAEGRIPPGGGMARQRRARSVHSDPDAMDITEAAPPAPRTNGAPSSSRRKSGPKTANGTSSRRSRPSKAKPKAEPKSRAKPKPKPESEPDPEPEVDDENPADEGNTNTRGDGSDPAEHEDEPATLNEDDENVNAAGDGKSEAVRSEEKATTPSSRKRGSTTTTPKEVDAPEVAGGDADEGDPNATEDEALDEDEEKAAPERSAGKSGRGRRSVNVKAEAAGDAESGRPRSGSGGGGSVRAKRKRTLSAA